MKTYAKGEWKKKLPVVICSSWYDHDTGYLYGSGI